MYWFHNDVCIICVCIYVYTTHIIDKIVWYSTSNVVLDKKLDLVFTLEKLKLKITCNNFYNNWVIQNFYSNQILYKIVFVCFRITRKRIIINTKKIIPNVYSIIIFYF